MAKNQDCKTSDANTNGETPCALKTQNQNNVRLSSRKRHNSDSAVELLASEIKRKRRCPAVNSLAAESGSSIRTEKSLDELPSEMLESVLQKLPTSDLLSCRQVNRKFNGIASRIMRKRADIQLHFSDGNKDGKFMRTIQIRCCQKLLLDICKPYEKVSSKSLKELVLCLRETEHFPITSFRFDDLNKFGNEDMESFLSIWGTEIVALTVSIKDARSDVGILRNLLVKTVPQLKELQIIFHGWKTNPATSELFADFDVFQLPNLEILRTNKCYRAHRPMIEKILMAAPNLKNFYHFNSERSIGRNELVQNETTADDLTMLQTLNKFHCLQHLRINLSEDLIRFLALKRIDFKLESLALSLQSSHLNEQLKSSATAILNQLFQSSKDVIQTLRIEPLGPLGPNLNIPKMMNLRKLELFGTSNEFPTESEEVGIFSPLFEMADDFPNLKELTVSNLGGVASMFQTSQQLKPMPSIKVLRIIGKLTAECEEKLLQATPNVTTLVIEENGFDWENLSHTYSVSINFRMIANCLPKLQSFGWSIFRGTHRDLFHCLDAAITGLPVEFCEEISKKFQNRDSLSADALSSHQLEQRTSSILDLKELKQFDVSFSFDGGAYVDIDAEDSWIGCGWLAKEDEAGFSAGDILYRTGFSKVSKFLAFDLMPNLNVQTHRFLHY